MHGLNSAVKSVRILVLFDLIKQATPISNLSLCGKSLFY